MKHLQGIFGVDVRGLRERHQDIVVESSCLGPESTGQFAEDHTRTDQSFGVVVIGRDSVREVQERQEFVLLFEQSFAETTDVGI